MPRGKDQKSIAKRIDLHYPTKSHPMRHWRRIAVLACTLLAGSWMVWAYTTDDERIYNPGHVTSAHATIEHNCAACHAPDPEHKGQFLKAVNDSACLSCHEAPMHAPTQLVQEGENVDNPLAMVVAWMSDDAGAKPTAADKPAEEAAPAEGETPAAPTEGAAPAEGATAEGGDKAKSQPADHHHGAMLVSSQCASCHVEHRGRDAVAAVSDQHCTQCHEDLSKALHPGKTSAMQNRVVAFTKDKADHPDFGRLLPKDEKGNFRDDTKLKFNHAFHILEQGTTDCSMCHTTQQPNLTRFRPGHDASKPPFAVERQRPEAWASSGDGRYMQPISYEQHCQQCHPIKASPLIKGDLPHDRIEIVRAYVEAQFRQAAQDRYDAGAPGAAAPAGGAPKGGKKGGKAGAKKDAGPADEGDWLAAQMGPINKAVLAVQKTCAKCHETTSGEGKPAEAVTDAGDRVWGEQQMIAWIKSQRRMGDGDAVAQLLWDGTGADVTFTQAAPKRKSRRPGGSSSTPPAAETPAEPAAPAEPAPAEPAPTPAEEPAAAPAAPETAAPAPAPSAPRTGTKSRRPGGSSAAAPTTPAAPGRTAAPAPTAPAAPKAKPRKPLPTPETITVLPTGMTDHPRRWFTASQFDHRSHRDMACVECHSKLNDLKGLQARVAGRLKQLNIESPSAGEMFKLVDNGKDPKADEAEFVQKISQIDDDALERAVFAVTQTREMMSPAISWTIENHGGATGATPTTVNRACTDCHQPDTRTQRFTTSACVACHLYHDHSKELYPDGRHEPRKKEAEAAAAAPTAASPAPEAAPAGETPPADAPAEATPAPDAAPAEAPAETPAAETPAPAAEEPKPAEPAAETPAAAAAEEPKPAEAPAAEAPTPAAPAEEAAKAAEEAKPAEEAAAAPAEEAKPAEEASTETKSAAPRKSRRPKTSGK